MVWYRIRRSEREVISYLLTWLKKKLRWAYHTGWALYKYCCNWRTDLWIGHGKKTNQRTMRACSPIGSIAYVKDNPKGWSVPKQENCGSHFATCNFHCCQAFGCLYHQHKPTFPLMRNIASDCQRSIPSKSCYYGNYCLSWLQRSSKECLLNRLLVIGDYFLKFVYIAFDWTCQNSPFVVSGLAKSECRFVIQPSCQQCYLDVLVLRRTIDP